MKHNWDDHYASGDVPWDRNEPEPELVKLLESGRLPRGRALDIGCGTGSSVRYLASRGYDVVGVDVSRLAIERAAAVSNPPGDRGCLHVFDDPGEQALFAKRVAGCLAPEGRWVSFLGSTEGPPRDEGPPRRSARDIVNAVEPVLAVVELREIQFDIDLPSRASAWLLVARRRGVPAQLSTARD